MEEKEGGRRGSREETRGLLTLVFQNLVDTTILTGCEGGVRCRQFSLELREMGTSRGIRLDTPGSPPWLGPTSQGGAFLEAEGVGSFLLL